MFELHRRGICDILPFSPCLQLEKPSRGLIGKIANDIAIETGLNVYCTREV